MDAALILKFSSGSMYSYSRRQTSSLALPHQPSRPPRYDQYEISGLTHLFHPNSAPACEHLMDAVLSSKSFSGGVYSPLYRQTSSLALPHQSLGALRHDQYEICVLMTSQVILY